MHRFVCTGVGIAFIAVFYQFTSAQNPCCYNCHETPYEKCPNVNCPPGGVINTEYGCNATKCSQCHSSDQNEIGCCLTKYGTYGCCYAQMPPYYIQFCQNQTDPYDSSRPNPQWCPGTCCPDQESCCPAGFSCGKDGSCFNATAPPGDRQFFSFPATKLVIPQWQK